MIGGTLGPFRVESELGSGGMGRVYCAVVAGRWPGLEVGTRVALKLVHPNLLEAPSFFQRFLREADIGKRVNHPNVVRTFGCDQVVRDGVHHSFLVMELVEGQTLRQLLDELGRVPEDLCRHVGREVCRGLAAIHEVGVVHRDLKLENVLITADHTVKVMDLGVAQLQNEVVRLSQTGAFVGSIHYAAPEQFGPGPVDTRCDLHALGVLLYELAVGRHPFWDDDFRVVMRKITSEEPRRAGAINPQLSAFVEEVVHRLLRKNPDERFGSATEVAEILGAGEESAWWTQHASDLRRQTRKPLRPIRIPRETALYGRQRELEQLHAVFGRVSGGEGQVVLVQGEAGIGKTRVVDEFVAGLVEGGADVNFLFGSYPPGGAATAAGAFSTAYRAQFGPEDLQATLSLYLQDTPTLIPAFAALLSGDATPAGSEALTKDSLQTVFVHATRALAAERPTIVLIDDLHFAPPEGRALWMAVAQATASDRVLLIGTTRPGLPAEWTAGVDRLRGAHRVELARLGAKDLGELLIDAFASRRLAEVLALKIAQKSDGNPFFVFEILRGMRERGILRREPDGSWSSTREVRELEIPSSVRDLLRARINALESDEDRDLLEVASCCGFEFDPLLVGRVLGLADIPLLKRLGRIEHTSRLVRSAGRQFVFDHHQVQESLYASISELLRERYHAALGKALEETLGAGVGEPAANANAVALANHLLIGGENERAVRYLAPAMDHLAAGYLFDDALTLAQRALDVPTLLAGVPRLEVLLRCQRWLNWLGRWDAREAILDEALAIADKTGEPSRQASVRVAVANLMQMRGAHADSLGVLDDAVDFARTASDLAVEGSALSMRGQTLKMLGRTDEAFTCYERALEIAQQRDDPETQMMAALGLGLLCKRVDRIDESIHYHELNLTLSREHGDRRDLAIALGNIGALLETLKRVDEAAPYQRECIRIARELGDRRTELIALFNVGGVQLDQRKFDAALATFERVLRLSREIGYVRGESAVAGNLGLVYLQTGQVAEALASQLEQLRLALAHDEAATGINANVNLASTYSIVGDFDRAHACAQAALTGAVATKETRLESFANSALGDVAAAAERFESAEGHLRIVVERMRTSARGPDLGTALVTLAGVLLAQGKADATRAVLGELHDLRERTGDDSHVLLCAAYRSQLEGDPELARTAARDQELALSVPSRMTQSHELWRATGDREHIEEALRCLEQLRTNAPPQYRDRILTDVPRHRSIVAASRGADNRSG